MQKRQQNQNFYGKYNKCKYEIWPWPQEVECTSSQGDSSSLALDPMRFRIVFTPESKVKNSSVLETAFSRYQGLIFNQPTRVSRGKLVEPQFHFEEDDDDDDKEGEKEKGGEESGHEGDSRTLTTLLVTIIEDISDHIKPADADESYEVVVDQQGSASLTAQSVWGALYGLDTFSQLVERGSSGTSAEFVLRGGE